VSEQNQGNGLAAVFFVTGCLAYAGYFWPVSDDGAGLFARAFYSALIESENAGEAFQVARVEALRELGERGDLTGYGAILYGDAGTKERRDVFTAA
jgi:CHAT domain-containing protein